MIALHRPIQAPPYTVWTLDKTLLEVGSAKSEVGKGPKMGVPH